MLGAGYAAAVDVEPYAARYRSQRVGIFGVARRMKSTGRGRPRRVRSSICTSCGSRLPLRRLQGAHEVTTFSQIESPPRERGIDVVERQPAARRAAVDAAPAVTGEERPARDLALDDPRNADVVHEPDDVWPRKLPRGRAKWSVELFDDLRLPLVDEHVRAPQRAHVERLVTRVQDENLLHPG